jgi:predicted Zn-dependent peptidase
MQTSTVFKKVFKIIEDIKKKGVTEEELRMTKEQIKTELILGNESAKNRMNSNGKSMINRGRIVPIEEMIEGIQAVSLEEVRNFANRYFDIPSCSISLVGNLKEIDIKSLAVS